MSWIDPGRVWRFPFSLGVLSVAMPTLLASQTVTGILRYEGRPAPDAVVYLLGGTPVAPLPDPVVVDQRHLRFVPSTIAIPPGTAIEFRNSDPVLHNVFGPEGSGRGFDLGLYMQNDPRRHTFGSEGVYVVLCRVHPEMMANVVVVPSAYRAVTRADGSFTIPEVPAGRLELRVWHPSAGDVSVGTAEVGNEGLDVEIDLPEDVRGSDRGSDEGVGE